MNFQYHRKVLVKTDFEHPMVQQALTLLDAMEDVQKRFAEGEINVEEYIAGMRDYDYVMYTNARTGPQASNPINTKQNKKLSSYYEQLWLPVWCRIYKELISLEAWKDTNLVILQNKRIVERIYTNGKIATKDIDGGIAIEIKLNGKRYFIPIIAMEHKGGHACKTVHSGVDAQGERIHKSFPNACHVFITDNNVTVGKDSLEFPHTNITISERGNEGVKNEYYPELRADRFKFFEEYLIKKLSEMKPSDFINFKEEETSNRNYWDARAASGNKPDGTILNWNPKKVE